MFNYTVMPLYIVFCQGTFVYYYVSIGTCGSVHVLSITVRCITLILNKVLKGTYHTFTVLVDFLPFHFVRVHMVTILWVMVRSKYTASRPSLLMRCLIVLI